MDDKINVTIWTMFYTPMVMGGNVWKAKGFVHSVDVDKIQDLGKGYKGFELTLPDGDIRIVELSTGGIIGDNLQQVRTDVESCDKKVLEEQLEEGKKRLSSLSIIDEKEFWNIYRKQK